jgi:hypothetical protein
MEIAPISGIRVMPVRRVQPSEPSLSGVFDISLSRSQDDSYSGNGKSTGGQDGQDDEQDEMLDEQSPLNKPYISERVSFFA